MNDGLFLEHETVKPLGYAELESFQDDSSKAVLAKPIVILHAEPVIPGDLAVDVRLDVGSRDVIFEHLAIRDARRYPTRIFLALGQLMTFLRLRREIAVSWVI